MFVLVHGQEDVQRKHLLHSAIAWSSTRTAQSALQLRLHSRQTGSCSSYTIRHIFKYGIQIHHPRLLNDVSAVI